MDLTPEQWLATEPYFPQEERRLTKNLVLHYKRKKYMIRDTEENRRFRGAYARIRTVRHTLPELVKI